MVLCHRFIAHKNGACIQNLTELFDWLLEHFNHKPQLTQEHLINLCSVVSTLCQLNTGLSSYQCNVLIEKVSGNIKQMFL